MEPRTLVDCKSVGNQPSLATFPSSQILGDLFEGDGEGGWRLESGHPWRGRPSVDHLLLHKRSCVFPLLISGGSLQSRGLVALMAAEFRSVESMNAKMDSQEPMQAVMDW